MAEGSENVLDEGFSSAVRSFRFTLSFQTVEARSFSPSSSSRHHARSRWAQDIEQGCGGHNAGYTGQGRAQDTGQGGEGSCGGSAFIR